MEMTELRSKEEVKQEIEATRRESKRALREAKSAWITENPAVVAWRKTKARAYDTKVAVTDKAHATDSAVRSNIYKLLGAAALVGAAVGFFAKRKRARNRFVMDRCC